MKVLLVSSSSGSRGGGEFYLKSLAAGLMSKGHEVLTLMSSGNQMDEMAAAFSAEGLRIQRFSYTNTYQRRSRTLGAVCDVVQRRQTSQFLRSLSPDIIHINQQCVEDGLDLVLAARDTGIPSVSTIHVTRSMASLGAFASYFRDLIARFVLRTSGVPLVGISPVSSRDLADYVASTTVTMKQSVESSLVRFESGDAKTDISVYCVPNGVPIPNSENRSQLRMQWSIPDCAVVIGVVARIEHQKNPLFMVKLLDQLPAHVHIVWIGDGRMRNQLEAAIKQSPGGSRFHLDGWRDNAASRMAGLDIFALPSLYEGLPLALLEAMSLGLTCIASDVDGTRDAIVHGESGFLCPANDVNEWVRALTPLIKSSELRSIIGENARLRHHTEFSLEQMATRTAAVYASVIQRRHELVNAMNNPGADVHRAITVKKQ